MLESMAKMDFSSEDGLWEMGDGNGRFDSFLFLRLFPFFLVESD